MSGPDLRSPGQFRPDLLTSQSSLELTSRQYFDGLSVWDAYRVSLFVHLIRRATGEDLNRFAVMAYGSTTRPKDRAHARDIDLKVLSTASGSERDREVYRIRDQIRKHYERLQIPFQEYAQTFRWNTPHVNEVFADAISNEDPSFVIHPTEDVPGLPLHVSIDGKYGLPAKDKVEIYRRNSNRSFAVLLEP